MDNSPPDRTTAPASLLSQWWTLGAILSDSRTAGRHAKVAWVILDRHMRKSGNARASIRYLESATGISQHTVIKACRELVEWGYFDQHLGSGTRATEYSPKWLVLHPSTALASAEQGYSTGAEQGYSTTGSSAEQGYSESYLHEPADKAGLNVSNEVASPTAADGLTATAPSEGFEEIWRAYKKHGNKARAREAFAAINLDTFDLDTIVARAASWAASAKPGQRRMPLEKWLEAEKFDEADRAVEPKAKASVAEPDGDQPKRRPKPPHAVRRDATVRTINMLDNGAEIEWEWHDAMPGEAKTHRKFYPSDEVEQMSLAAGRVAFMLTGTRFVIHAGDEYSTYELHLANDNRPATTRHTVRITEAWINRNSQGTLLSASLERLDGQPAKTSVIHIAIEDYERQVQEQGRHQFEQLIAAMGIPGCDEPEELIGHPFDLVVDGDGGQEFHSVTPIGKQLNARA